LQRGGTPTAYDRILATRFGLSAIDAAESGAFGMMTALNANSIQHAPLTLTEGTTRTVDLSLYDEIDDVFFG
jgi:6-phosphofructokinase 1